MAAGDIAPKSETLTGQVRDIAVSMGLLALAIALIVIVSDVDPHTDAF